MFFGLAETITNQTVAVAVLVMILGGLGWLIRQLLSLAPTVLDRLDKQEEKRTESMEKMADRLEKAIEKLSEKFDEKIIVCLYEKHPTASGEDLKQDAA